MIIKISKRIKPPLQRGRGRPPLSPWRDLLPGHSLFLPHRSTGGLTTYWKKITGWDFVSRRTIEGDPPIEGVRVWRLR